MDNIDEYIVLINNLCLYIVFNTHYDNRNDIDQYISTGHFLEHESRQWLVFSTLLKCVKTHFSLDKNVTVPKNVNNIVFTYYYYYINNYHINTNCSIQEFFWVVYKHRTLVFFNHPSSNFSVWTDLLYFILRTFWIQPQRLWIVFR